MQISKAAIAIGASTVAVGGLIALAVTRDGDEGSDETLATGLDFVGKTPASAAHDLIGAYDADGDGAITLGPKELLRRDAAGQAFTLVPRADGLLPFAAMDATNDGVTELAEASRYLAGLAGVPEDAVMDAAASDRITAQFTEKAVITGS